MVKSKEYSNGLRLIVSQMEGMLSVSAGVLVGAGSKFEDSNNNGISHFMEHMNFKGTKTQTSFEVSDNFDSLGSQVNAFTSKELTCYYVKSTSDALDRSVYLLSDIFINSIYDEVELGKEKGVVLEEINMSKDTPEDVCHENLCANFYGNAGLGQTILGTADRVNSFTRQSILDYKNCFYTADNIVISMAGNISFEMADELVKKYFVDFIPKSKKSKVQDINKINLCNHSMEKKDIEQVHISLAYNGLPFDHADGSALSLINCTLGGGMSSRLFQEIREKRGLCYTVYSFPSSYKDTGMFCVYAGLNPSKYMEGYENIKKVIEETQKNGITEREFERGKAQINSSFVFGEESSSSQMMLYGKYLLFTNSIYKVQDKLSQIRQLTLDKVNAVLSDLDLTNLSTSIVGKDIEKLQ